MKLAFAALASRNPAEKCRLALAAHARWEAGEREEATGFVVPEAGCPAHPALVEPHRVARRGVGTERGRAALLHAIAHIEFNAINLALDAACRFRAMPPEFRGDWLRVAAEEAKHFGLLEACLVRRGFGYGDFAAHAGLWEAARRTRDDPLARMALVPRVLEARGLDVTPGLRARLAAAGDEEAAGILDVILAEEVGHVAVGNRWYRHLCVQRALDPLTADTDLARRLGTPGPKPPFNIAARRAAGFTEAEIGRLPGA
jgi:uncharacterized ferritin-like protein (DUF455 family)